jgi:hypothetical protein
MIDPIISIPADAREDTEQLGSKPKFWVLLGDERWLFKEARPATGEDWAEKVAAEIAKAIGIRSAAVELAEYQGRRGCISRNFVDVRSGQALVAGYIVLDALIGNTDRHHENWGLLLNVQTDLRAINLSVAPSFDHASSLGRELRDERRLQLLSEGRVGWYVRKGKGGIFKSPSERHGENPLRLVQFAAQAYPSLFKPALERTAALSAGDIHRIVHALPDARASEPAKRFAEAMILDARASLTEILR